jgi:hypothetical protein
MSPAVGVYDTLSIPGAVTLGTVPGQLIISVSGIRDRTIAGVDEFCGLLDVRDVPVSLLVAPRLAGGYRLTQDPGAAEWLRHRRDRGDAIVLHGFDAAATNKRRPEFATLPEHEANLRLMAGHRALDHVGLRTRLFAPPGWLASDGALRALPRNGFRLLATVTGITDLVRDTTERARVIGIGAGLLAEPWWCRAVVLSAERVARRGGIVRIALSAKQLARPGLRRAMVDAAGAALSHGVTPTVYQWNPARPPLLLEAA